MRLLTMLQLIHGATSGRLARLSTRLASAPGDAFGRRYAVRLVWATMIKDVLEDRVKYHITDN